MKATWMDRAMLFGYSLVIDEYVDANQLETADCDVLKVCCPVCMKPASLIWVAGRPDLDHVQAVLNDPVLRCEDRLTDFAPEYKEERNARAREKRLETIQSHLFKDLLDRDPLARFEDQAVMISGKLKSRGAMPWLIRWHLDMAVDVCRRLEDQIEFRGDGEVYLAQFGADKIDIPSSGLARQVHFQIAYDFMQHVLSRKGLADDDYSWLFAHALRRCLPKWATDAELDGNDAEEYPKDADAPAREKIAASRIIVRCFCDFLLDDKHKHVEAMETLADLEIKPPLAPIVMPLVSFVGLEILNAMKTTLFRLPYLSMLSAYDRPCRPAVA